MLIIGGTGMLAGAALHLAGAGHRVSVIGRSKEKFDLLQAQTEYPIYPLLADYREEGLYDLVQQSITERGLFDEIISWCPESHVLERIAGLNAKAEACTVLQVKGSRRYFSDEAVVLPGNCRISEVFLGYIIEGDESRWLTHEEISLGVIAALVKEKKRSIIGQIEPYGKRPL
jgi:hypothetical protein